MVSVETPNQHLTEKNVAVNKVKFFHLMKSQGSIQPPPLNLHLHNSMYVQIQAENLQEAAKRIKAPIACLVTTFTTMEKKTRIMEWKQRKDVGLTHSLWWHFSSQKCFNVTANKILTAEHAMRNNYLQFSEKKQWFMDDQIDTAKKTNRRVAFVENFCRCYSSSHIVWIFFSIVSIKVFDCQSSSLDSCHADDSCLSSYNPFSKLWQGQEVE